MNLGVFGIPVIKITLVRQVRMLPVCNAIWAWRQTSATELRTACEDREHICFGFIFVYVVGKNPKTPELNPMVYNAITRDGMRRCGISGVYLWFQPICPPYVSKFSQTKMACNTCNIICWKDSGLFPNCLLTTLNLKFFHPVLRIFSTENYLMAEA